MELISIQQYAKQNNVSVSIVRRLIKDGLLEHCKFGRIYRIPSGALPIEATPEPKGKHSTKDEYKAALKNICVIQ